MELIQTIDAMGGSVAAIEEGFIQDEIARSAYEYQKNWRTATRSSLVSISSHQNRRDHIPVFRIDDSIRKMQSDKLASLRARRNNQALSERLAALKAAAESGDNIMPVVLKRLSIDATLGEIADVLRKVFGGINK